MIDTNIYIYAAIIAIALVVEALTTSLVAIWFVPSAIVGIVLSALKVNTVVQLIIFFVLSIVLMLLFYKKLRDVIATKTEKTGIDALIGSEGIVEESISRFKPGRVKVGAMSWSAYIDKDSEEIEKGEIVTVLAIDGVKLKCKKQNSQETVHASNK